MSILCRRNGSFGLSTSAEHLVHLSDNWTCNPSALGISSFNLVHLPRHQPLLWLCCGNVCFHIQSRTEKQIENQQTRRSYTNFRQTTHSKTRPLRKKRGLAGDAATVMGVRIPPLALSCEENSYGLCGCSGDLASMVVRAVIMQL